MTTIAATADTVYTLESGTIYSHKANAKGERHSIQTPSDVDQIMTTNDHLYALIDDGSVVRRAHNQGSWVSIAVPAGTTHISSNDSNIFALATQLYRRHPSQYDTFSQVTAMNLASMVQVDHDEEFSFALTSGGDLYVTRTGGAWMEYPEELNGIVQVRAGWEYVYALTDDGEVFRSKHSGYSGWTKLGDFTDIQDICIDSMHQDKLWMLRPSGIYSQSADSWWSVSGVVSTPEGWVVAGWADNWVVEEAA